MTILYELTSVGAENTLRRTQARVLTHVIKIKFYIFLGASLINNDLKGQIINEYCRVTNLQAVHNLYKWLVSTRIG